MQALLAWLAAPAQPMSGDELELLLVVGFIVALLPWAFPSWFGERRGRARRSSTSGTKPPAPR